MPIRGATFSPQEVNFLLDNIDASVCKYNFPNWDLIKKQHDEKYSLENSNKVSLQKKFKSLRKEEPKTGSSFCSKEVRRAKDLYQRM
jgi:hypothetical protein